MNNIMSYDGKDYIYYMFSKTDYSLIEPKSYNRDITKMLPYSIRNNNDKNNILICLQNNLDVLQNNFDINTFLFILKNITIDKLKSYFSYNQKIYEILKHYDSLNIQYVINYIVEHNLDIYKEDNILFFISFMDDLSISNKKKVLSIYSSLCTIGVISLSDIIPLLPIVKCINIWEQYDLIKYIDYTKLIENFDLYDNNNINDILIFFDKIYLSNIKNINNIEYCVLCIITHYSTSTLIEKTSKQIIKKILKYCNIKMIFDNCYNYYLYGRNGILKFLLFFKPIFYARDELRFLKKLKKRDYRVIEYIYENYDFKYLKNKEYVQGLLFFKKLQSI